MTTLITIQEAYIATVNAGRARWAHRRNGGHYGRIRGGAYKRAAAALARLGYTPEQAKACIRDSQDVADLQWHATCDE